VQVAAAGGCERGPHLFGIAVHVNAKEDRAALDFGFERLGASPIDARVSKRRRQAAGDVPRGLAEPCRQRAGGDNRPDAWQHEGNGREHETAPLPQTRCGTRIFDFRARRRFQLAREHALLVVIAGDDRDLLAGDAARVQRACGGPHVGGAIEESEDQWMIHASGHYSRSTETEEEDTNRTVTAYDVVIIGAGPAGSIAARDLARAGARVAVVDGSHPREKCCGGGVTGRALALAGPRIHAHGQTDDGCVIRSAVFEAAPGLSTDKSTTDTHGWTRISLESRDALTVFSRATFDAALLAEAVAAGATHVNARARTIDGRAGAWTVACGRDTVRAAWILGADGPSGIVRKHVFRAFERSQLSIAAGSFVDGVAADEVVIRFVDNPRGYLWSFPRRDHLAVGTCAQADESTSAALHRVTDEWLERYPAAAARPRRRYAWPIPSLSARDLDREQPSGDGWMLLGDAAGLVDPITREGIFFAMRSGQLAAGALVRADAASVYADSMRDELHAELRRAADLKAAFFRPRFTRLLVDALSRSAAIRSVMIDLIAGRQPYAGLKRRLLGTLELGLMAKLFVLRRGRLGEARPA